ncbi:MAG: carboxymuconolactone decarboxylase family protein [Pseudomonadota bacterium]
MHKKRINPVAPADFDATQAEFFKPFLRPDGSIHNVYGTLAHHVDLAKAWSGFGLYTMRGSTVDPILREVAILQAAKNSDCAYEFHHHAEIARHLGLPEDDIEAIQAGTPLPAPDRALMVTCANDLSEYAKLSDATWGEMTETFGLKTTFDVIFTIGAYSTLALALNSCGVEID